MAFMKPPATTTGSNDDRMPILAFNAKSGRLVFLDRVQRTDGKWETVKTDITMEQRPFAVDFGRLQTGWIHFSNVGPQFATAFYGQPTPACPDSPGTSSDGKALRFKAGFRVPVIGQAIGGVREFRGNAGTIIAGMNLLHDDYEVSPEGRAGKIPLVKMTGVIEVAAGQSSNYQPIFTIQAWVDRPAALGPRMVPLPGAAPVPVVARPTPQPAAAHRTEPPAHRYAAEVADRWHEEPPDDDRWDNDAAPPRTVNGTVAARMTSQRDDRLTF